MHAVAVTCWVTRVHRGTLPVKLIRRASFWKKPLPDLSCCVVCICATFGATLSESVCRYCHTDYRDTTNTVNGRICWTRRGTACDAVIRSGCWDKDGTFFFKDHSHVQHQIEMFWCHCSPSNADTEYWSNTWMRVCWCDSRKNWWNYSFIFFKSNKTNKYIRWIVFINQCTKIYI